MDNFNSRLGIHGDGTVYLFCINKRNSLKELMEQ